MIFTRMADILWTYRDVFVSGIWITIQLAFIAYFLAVVTGMIACLGSLSRNRVIRAPAVFYIEFSRNTPILVQVVWVHFAWPEILGVSFTAYTSAVIALMLQSSGYLAEEYRAGIESIDKGQIEASQSLGMTYPRLMRRIVIPQAVMRMIPGILNQFVTCFKSTSIVSVIAVHDLMYQGQVLVSSTFLPMEIYTIVAAMYFLMVFAFSTLVRRLSRRLPTFGYFQHAGA